MMPHGTRTRYAKNRCRCEPCREANREYMREYAAVARTYYPGIPDVDPTPAREHIEHLRAQGMGSTEISRAAGVRKSTILSIARGQWVRGIRPDTERRILAVRPDPWLVDSTGPGRRLRALAALGYTQRDLMEATGLSSRTVGVVCRDEQPMIYRPTADAIRDAYERLCMTVGPSDRARRCAARKGWAPPLAWDDIDTDDAPVDMTTTGRQHADLDEWLHLVRGGVHPQEAARRLGVTVSGISASAWRRGRTDVHALVQPALHEHRRAA